MPQGREKNSLVQEDTLARSTTQGANPNARGHEGERVCVHVSKYLAYILLEFEYFLDTYDSLSSILKTNVLLLKEMSI